MFVQTKIIPFHICCAFQRFLTFFLLFKPISVISSQKSNVDKLWRVDKNRKNTVFLFIFSVFFFIWAVKSLLKVFKRRKNQWKIVFWPAFRGGGGFAAPEAGQNKQHIFLLDRSIWLFVFARKNLNFAITES